MLLRALLWLTDEADRAKVGAALGRLDSVHVSEMESGERIWERLSSEPVDLIVVDRELLSRPVGQSVSAFRQLPEQPEVLVAWRGGEPKAQAGILAAGALSVIHLGLTDRALSAELRPLVGRVREQKLARWKDSLAAPPDRLATVRSSSPAMQRLVDLAGRVARTDTSLLLLGETGVGKEWLARTIHEEGPRAGGPFLAVNCGAIPEALLESELFGHEEGAFTGAHRAHRGHFELADGGTLFLDEVAEMPPHVQVRLLRVLQERRIKRVGGEEEIPTNVRIMAATNRDLDEEMNAGRFRPDLYYRLGVMTLTVPALRERREDIPGLVHEQVERFRNQLSSPVQSVSPEAMDALVGYDWPGNVRELINVVERAVLLCAGKTIGLEDLPPMSPARGPGGNGRATQHTATFGDDENLLARTLPEARQDLVRSFERAYLDRALRDSAGRIGDTARLAGLSERAVFDKMKQYGLRKEDYRSGAGDGAR